MGHNKPFQLILIHGYQGYLIKFSNVGRPGIPFISEVKQKCTELGVVWVTNLIPTLGGDKNTYQNAKGN